MYLLEIDNDELDKITLYDVEAFLNIFPFISEIRNLTKQEMEYLEKAEDAEQIYRSDIHALQKQLYDLKEELIKERKKPKTIQANSNYTEVLKFKALLEASKQENDFYKGLLSEIEKDIDLKEYVKRLNDSLR